MKDINYYDLLKLLLAKLDTIWRLEKHYLADAKKANCSSASVLEKILEEEKRHVAELKKSLEQRVDTKVFD